MTAWTDFMTAVNGRAAGASVAAMGAQQEPTDADLADASADRAEHAGDGPDVEPVYASPRPLVDETHVARLVEAVASVLIGVPVPSGSVAFSTTIASGVPVQVVPASGGRRRRVIIHNADTSKAVNLSPDRREDATGFTLDPGMELETTTQSAVWAYVATGDVLVSVWADHYADPS